MKSRQFARTHTVRIGVVCSLASVLIFKASVVFALPLLGNAGTGQIYDVNTSTGAATNPRPTGIDFLVGISLGPDGNLYGLTTFASSPANSLVRINQNTGAFVTVGSTGLSSIFEGDIEFDPATGTCYGLVYAPGDGSSHLFTINRTTGTATFVGPVNAPASDLSAMAFAPNGNLYVLDTEHDQLLRVNPATAAVITSVNISTPLGFVAGMDFDPSTGVLYVADGSTLGTNSLYTMNPVTGAMTLIGPTVQGGLAGLTFVPEPAAATTLGIAMVLSTLRRRAATASPPVRSRRP